MPAAARHSDSARCDDGGGAGPDVTGTPRGGAGVPASSARVEA